MESLGKLERRSLLRFSEREEETSTGSRKNSVNLQGKIQERNFLVRHTEMVKVYGRQNCKIEELNDGIDLLPSQLCFICSFFCPLNTQSICSYILILCVSFKPLYLHLGLTAGKGKPISHLWPAQILTAFAKATLITPYLCITDFTGFPLGFQ